MMGTWLRTTTLPAVGLLLLGCAGDDSTGGTAPQLGNTSTGSDPETSTTGDPTTGAPDPMTTGPDDPPATTEDSGSPDSSSSGPGCTPGTTDCSCDAGTCQDDLVCLGDTCHELQCDGDVFEDNDQESTAIDLGEIDDGDRSVIVSGSLHHPGDVDWYVYHGDDDFGSMVDPARELVASGGLRLCKFVECDVGLADTELECPVGTDYALSTMARPGCCDDTDFELADLNCTGTTEDSANVYIRVDQPSRECISYSISYHY